MAKAYTVEYVRELGEKVDIADVIEMYIPLKRSSGQIITLCPFHTEKKPTLQIDVKKQTFLCSACKADGDVFDFLVRINKFTIEEAFKEVEIIVGESDSKECDDSQQAQHIGIMYEAHDITLRLYHHVLTSTDQGRDALSYLLKRGLTLKTIEEFQLGFAPDSWDFATNFLKGRGFDLEIMVTAGLLAKSDKSGKIFDRFRGRIMFPIQNVDGKTIAFGGRAISDEINPKYLNSPDTPIFQKGETIFNLHRVTDTLRQSNTKQPVYLFEGYMDVISVWQAGYHHGLATLGTAITSQQAKVIHVTSEDVIICYDGDKAGQDATSKAISFLEREGCSIKISKIPGNADPDEYIKMYGPQEFGLNILNKSLSVGEYHIQRLLAQCDFTLIEDFTDYVTKSMLVMQVVNDEDEKRKIALQIATDTQISPDILQSYYLKIPN